MDVKQNFERLTDETREYINLHVDCIKLYIIEALSLFASDLFSRTLFFMFLFLSLIFLLVALMFFMSASVGIIFSAIIVSFILLSVAFLVYINRKRLFANIMVSSLCKIFFPKNDIDDETL